MVIYMTTPILPHNHGDIHNVLEAMPSKDTCADMASAFKQLCDGTRLQIFWLLCHSEECVLNISAAVGMSAPAVSHHLRCLKDAGLITGNRHGKEVHYHIASTTQAALLHHFVDSYLHTSCPGEFDSLFMTVLPKDPVILLSYINTQLRDFYPSLDELCSSLNADKQTLCNTLAQIDYYYDETSNQFV